MRPPVRRPAPASTSNGDNTTSNPSSVPTQQLQSQAQMSSFTSTMPTPPGYVCYRCGEKGLHFKLSKLINLIFLSGHWIQDCPTNGDPNYENKPRFKRTTGIPKSFLKTVDATTAASITNNGSNAAGVMITPDGSHVIATPDIATWEKSRAIKPVALTVNDIRESEPSDANLKCDLSGKLISNTIILPCCKKSYSEEYINQYLIENDFFCPNCHSNVGSLVNLSPNPPLKEKVVEYISQQLSLDRQKKDEEAKKNNQTDTKDEVEHTNKKGLFEDEINNRCYQSLITQIEIELADNVSKNFTSFECQLKLIDEDISNDAINVILKLIESHYTEQNITVEILNYDPSIRLIKLRVFIGNIKYAREDLKRLYIDSLPETIEREVDKFLDEINLKLEKEVIEHKNVDYIYNEDISNEHYDNNIMYNIMTRINDKLVYLGYDAYFIEDQNVYTLNVRL